MLLRRIVTSAISRSGPKCMNSSGREIQRVSLLPLRPYFGLRTFCSGANHLSNATLNQKLKEENYLIQGDPDEFGSLSAKVPDKPMSLEDIEEEKRREERPSGSQKLSTKQYADLIKAHIRNKKIKEAIDVLEERMIKVDRVQPENYIYNLLLGALGRVGYTKKAFSLYNNMKKRGLVVTAGTYTALFNACSNSPWPKDGLDRARHLRSIMLEKGHEPNDTTYNCMIKAFGRCGDLETAFMLVDEMIAKKIPVTSETFNFMLQSSITDKDAGFRHSLLVWKKLLNKKLEPNVYTYNLLLRSVRDCGLGSSESAQKVIETLVRDFEKLGSNQSSVKMLESTLESRTETNIVAMNDPEAELQSSSSLIAKVPTLGNILSIGEVTRPEDRLLLIGGVRGFLANMKEHNVTPDMKTFTLLLDCLPSTLSAEKVLLSAIKKLRVKPDIDFFNMLIKNRAMRMDYGGGREVLNLIEAANLRPDLVTYGVLSLGCKSKEEAQDLLEEMSERNYRINIQILGAMLKNACVKRNFEYVMEVMNIVLREDIAVSRKFIEILDRFRESCKEDGLRKTEHYTKGFGNFRKLYKTWIEQIKMDESEDAHPWEQFRRQSSTDARHAKDRQARFKPRIQSRFKQKTVNK